MYTKLIIYSSNRSPQETNLRHQGDENLPRETSLQYGLGGEQGRPCESDTLHLTDKERLDFNKLLYRKGLN